MRPRTRLGWIGVLLIGSMGYTMLIAIDPELARTVGVGYIAIVLTIFVANELWRKHE
jgi:hypothetical protein